MTRLIKLVITGNKGGTGKTTIAACLVEYLNYCGKKVQLLDVDPNQVGQMWVDNCYSEGRPVSSRPPVDYQVIDTAGVSGSSLTYLKQADLILVPFVPHYVDLQVIIPWFAELSQERQAKVVFWPNRYQNTKEQREGLAQVQELISEQGVGQILAPLRHRPALFGSLLNGSQQNFFQQREARTIQPIFQQLLNLCAK